MKLLNRLAPFLVTFLMLSNFAFAETKIFTREYTYEAGDIDSKISSRIIALEQVKRLLLEELGTALMSETVVTNGKLTKDEIMTFAGGIVKTSIIEEKWDGKSYRLKASIKADPLEVEKYINSVLLDRNKSGLLASESNLVRKLTSDIERLKNEIRTSADGDKIKQYEVAVSNLTTIEYMRQLDNIIYNNKVTDKTEIAKQCVEAIEIINKILTKIPNFSQMLQLRGEFYFGLEKYTDAIIDLNAAIYTDNWNIKDITTKTTHKEELPRIHSGILEQISYVQFKNGKYSDCINTLEKALTMKPNGFSLSSLWKVADLKLLIEKYPKDHRSWLYRGIFYENNYYSDDKYEDLAIQDYLKSLKIRNSSNAYYRLASMYRLYNKPWVKIDYTQKALEYYNKALNYKPSLELAKLIYCDIAGIYMDKEDYVSALSAYDKALKVIGTDGSVYIQKSIIYKKMEKYDEAVSELSNALFSTTKNYGDHWFGFEFDTHVYFFRAKANIDAGKLDYAIRDYTSYIDRQAESMRKDGRLDKDIIRYSGDGYFGRGCIYYDIGEYDKALNDLTVYLKSETKSPYAYIIRSRIYKKLNNYKAAQSDLSLALKSAQNDQKDFSYWAVLTERAELHMNYNNYKDAIDDLDKILDRNPDDVRALKNRGVSYYNLNINDQALKDFTSYLGVEPNSPKILAARGDILLKKGNLAGALQDLNYAIELDPKFDQAYFVRGTAYLELQQYAKGIEDIRIAARLGYETAKQFLKEKNVSW